MAKDIPQKRQKPVRKPTSSELEKENKFATPKYRAQMKASEGKQRPGK